VSEGFCRENMPVGGCLVLFDVRQLMGFITSAGKGERTYPFCVYLGPDLHHLGFDQLFTTAVFGDVEKSKVCQCLVVAFLLLCPRLAQEPFLMCKTIPRAIEATPEA